MAKFIRYDGNVVPFASNSTDDNRTIFGSTDQSDNINDNLNDDFKKGWEIVGVNDNPTKQDFNALSYTTTNLISYLYQQGMPEWNTNQNYYTNSFVMGSDGKIYISKSGDNDNPNQGNDPTTDDGTNWELYLSELVVNNVVKDADYTAVNRDFVWCDTATNGAWTLTLPANPNDFDKISIIDFKASFDDNNLTVARNGSTIMGVDEDLVVDTENANFSLIAINGDWRIFG